MPFSRLLSALTRLARLVLPRLSPRLRAPASALSPSSSPPPSFSSSCLASSLILSALWLSPLQATQVYVDALGGTGGNTYNNATNSLSDWFTNDAAGAGSNNKWGLRTSGVSVPGYGSNVYEIYTTETDITLRTEVTGLTPSTTYTGMRIYMIGRATAGASVNWPIDVSLNGTTWTTYADFDDTGYAGNLVDTSNNGVGTIQATTAITEKRVWYALPNATTDATGKLKVYIRRGTGASTRSVYDGIGYDNGVTVPTSPILAAATSSAVLDTSATLASNVTSDGNAAVTVRGFVLATSAANSNPLLGGSGVTNLPVSGTTGAFSTSATGLSAGTPYTFKAYATNSVGTTYTAAASFTTTAASDPYSNSVYISEFLADNPGPINLPGSLEDMDVNSSDWIELHNAGNTIAVLSGWKLTDDPLLPAKWTFPAGQTLAPGARLLVFASGKNRQLLGTELHANFKLSNSGFLQLSRPDLSGTDVVLSALTYSGQNNRASYGSTTTNPAALAYGFFTTPTPGAANAATSVPDFVASANTDVDRGIFSTAFTVTLSCPTPGATILYSLDGSVPTQGAAATTAIAPLDGLTLPTGTVNITTTTVLRTRAVKAGSGPSKTDTHTYLFPAHVLTQTAPPAFFPAAANWSHFSTLATNNALYATADWAMDSRVVNHANPDNQCVVNDLLSLPSLSLVMDWSELFGTSGVYPAIPPVPQEGYAKPANLELLNPDGSTSTPNLGDHFATLGRAHVFGGTSQTRSPTSWKVDKLSLNFNCLGSVTSTVFGDTSVGTYNRFILDGRMGNTWVHTQDAAQRTRGDYIRDEMAAATHRKMGYAGTHTRRVHLYLNGMYWGLYTLHEKPDAEFQAAYQGGNSDDWDVLKHNPNYRSDAVSCLSDGTFVNPAITANTKTNNTAYVNYLAMLSTVASGVDLTNSANYAAVGAKLDIEAFIDYIVLNFALNNFDWSHQNWYASYRRTSVDGRWRFHSWDAENVLRFDTEETVSGSGLITSASQADTPTYIHQRLATNAEYRMRFADRVQKWCFNGGPLSVTGIQGTLNEQFNIIDSAIRAESARWGDNGPTTAPYTPYTRVEHWLVEKNRMLGFIPSRLNILMAALKSKTNPMFPRLNPGDVNSAIFNAPTYAQHGGRVASGYGLTITNPNAVGAIYYTLDGSDPRLTGGTLSPAALAYTGPVPLAGSVTVKSRVLDGTNWTALSEAAFSVGTVAPNSSNLLISKIMWKPAPPSADDIAAGFLDDSDFEYLELINPSASPVDLTGLACTAGLDIAPYGTGPLELAPGARAVLAAKPSAFLRRYGNSANLVGKFINGSNLSGSETLTLVDSLGAVIQSFAYNSIATNPWPKAATSGTGAALVLIDQSGSANPALGASWRASSTPGGSPGFLDNSAPVTADDAYSLAEDGSLSTTAPGVLANDADPDLSIPTATLVLGPSVGTLSLSPDGSFTYTPPADFNGTVTFTYRATDGLLSSPDTTVTLTVNPVNDAPAFAANPISLNATEDAAFTGQLDASDPDTGETATLAYAKVSGPAWLSVSPTGALTGTPANADVGLNSFIVSVSDGTAPAVTATLNLTVANTNDAPAFAADPITADATGGTAFNGQLAASDPDTGETATLAYAKVSGPAWLSVSPTGALTGTPANADVGLNTFIVSVSDDIAPAVTASLQITVTASGPSFTAFTGEHFSPAEQANPAISGPDADPDHDGLPNLIEYAFATDPRAATSNRLPQSAVLPVSTDRFVGLTFTILKDAPDLSYTPEFSSSPSSGFSASSSIQTSLLDNGDGTQTITIRDTTPVSPATPRFVRLRITQN